MNKAAPNESTRDGANFVFNGILEAVSLQRLAPGTKLPEENLAQLFNVSRAHVRTALSRLKMRGLVQMEPNRTAQIAEPSVEEVLHLFAVRRWLEPELAADVALNLDEKGEQTIKAHVLKEQAARDAGDRDEATRLAGLYHSVIASCSANTIARQYVDELVDRSFLAIFLYQRVGEVMCVNEDHLQLFETLKARDPQKARQAMLSHLDHILSRLDLHNAEEPLPDLELAFRGIV